jgi:DnaJ-class molecular chaperone
MFKMMGDIPGNNNITDITEIEETDDNDSLKKTKDLHFNLEVSLEDLYIGKKKKLNVKIKKSTEDGEIVTEKKKLIVNLEKGMKNGEQIIFKGGADQITDYIPGDIIIKLVELEHSIFERSGDDLIINKSIDVYEVYNNVFYINHLDSSVLKIVNHSHILNKVKKIKGQGMPICADANNFGDLYIKFDIKFPSKKIPSILLKKMSTITKKPKAIQYNREYNLNNLSSESDSESDSESSSCSSSEYTTEEENDVLSLD